MTKFISRDGIDIFHLDRNLHGHFFGSRTAEVHRSYFANKAREFWEKLPPIQRLVIHDDVDRMKSVLQFAGGDPISLLDPMGRTVFWYACSPWSPKCFKALTSGEIKGVDTLKGDASGPSGQTIINRLCSHCTCDMLKTYIEIHPEQSQVLVKEALAYLEELVFPGDEDDLMLDFLRKKRME
jgi:hypothetical protein